MKTKPPTATVNLSDDIARDLDTIVEEYSPFVKPHRVLVVALRLGLDELRKDTSRLVTALRERAATT